MLVDCILVGAVKVTAWLHAMFVLLEVLVGINRSTCVYPTCGLSPVLIPLLLVAEPTSTCLLIVVELANLFPHALK
jgi:hypothetical protein